MIAEIKNIKTSNKDIKSFGITIGIILLFIAAFLFYSNKGSHQIFVITAVSFIGLGLIIPIILKPVYLMWMTFAAILGWVMTRLILTLVFYFILTPIGLLARVFGKDFLSLKKENLQTYWNKRDSDIEINQDYKKQF